MQADQLDIFYWWTRVFSSFSDHNILPSLSVCIESIIKFIPFLVRNSINIDTERLISHHKPRTSTSQPCLPKAGSANSSHWNRQGQRLVRQQQRRQAASTTTIIIIIINQNHPWGKRKPKFQEVSPGWKVLRN